LFGDAPDKGYVVLARKYRPATFEDMIGQEAMVKTIANSFAMGRIPHAYMLTGVRGVGKTTTARLLAGIELLTCGQGRPEREPDPAGRSLPGDHGKPAP
jgi:DNA polymerase-3 subunit gamma/tau